jgi:hypothetical protein
VTVDNVAHGREVGPVAEQPADTGHTNGQRRAHPGNSQVPGTVPSGFVPGTQLRGAAAGPQPRGTHSPFAARVPVFISAAKSTCRRRHPWDSTARVSGGRHHARSRIGATPLPQDELQVRHVPHRRPPGTVATLNAADSHVDTSASPKSRVAQQCPIRDPEPDPSPQGKVAPSRREHGKGNTETSASPPFNGQGTPRNCRQKGTQRVRFCSGQQPIGRRPLNRQKHPHGIARKRRQALGQWPPESAVEGLNSRRACERWARRHAIAACIVSPR